MAQEVPFQRSASVTGVPLSVEELPTAVHAEADVQDTAEKEPIGTSGLGVGTIDQAAVPNDGRGSAAGPRRRPERRRQSRAAGDLPDSCWPGTGGESSRQAAGVNRRWAGGRAAGGRAGAEAALAGDVTASIAAAPRATAAKTAAPLPGRH
jgi:hypothetical protein